MNVLGKAAHTRHTPFKLAEGEVKIRTHLNPAQQTSAGRSSGGQGFPGRRQVSFIGEMALDPKTPLAVCRPGDSTVVMKFDSRMKPVN